jgi:hypothetical protein
VRRETRYVSEAACPTSSRNDDDCRLRRPPRAPGGLGHADCTGDVDWRRRPAESLRARSAPASSTEARIATPTAGGFGEWGDSNWGAGGWGAGRGSEQASGGARGSGLNNRRRWGNERDEEGVVGWSTGAGGGRASSSIYGGRTRKLVLLPASASFPVRQRPFGAHVSFEKHCRIASLKFDLPPCRL